MASGSENTSNDGGWQRAVRITAAVSLVIISLAIGIMWKQKSSATSVVLGEEPVRPGTAGVPPARADDGVSDGSYSGVATGPGAPLNPAIDGGVGEAPPRAVN